MSPNRKVLTDLLLVLGCSTALVNLAACKKKSTTGGGGGGGSWLVGDNGTMANLLPDGTLGEGYELGADHDLLAIICRGLDTAFVVGEAGTLLRTFDGGETWDAIDLGTTATLRDVAAGSGETVYVAGDGVLLASGDSGDHWTAIPGGDRAWISLASESHDGVALALAADGSVWRWDGAQLLQVTSLAGARAVGLSHDGQFASLVGDDGAMVRSDDAGVTWEAVATGVEADLLATWVTEAGEVIGVGAAGTIVRASDDVLADAPGTGTLRAVHINDHGVGLAAGDGGEVLTTDDGGLSWRELDLAIGGTINGLDEVNGDGHL